VSRAPVFLLLFASLSAFAQAESQYCPDGTPKPRDVDLRSKMPPILDQDDMGWCVSYGSAAQLTYWAVQNGVPGISTREDGWISPTAIALSANRGRRQEAYKNVVARLAEVDAYEAALQPLTARKAVLEERRRTLEGKVPPKEWAWLLGELGRVSKDWAAQKEKIPKLFSEPEGALGKPVLEQALREGVCLERQVSSRDNGPGDRLNREWLDQAFNDAYGRFVARQTEENACVAAEKLHGLFRQVPVVEIQSVIRRVNSGEDPIEVLWRRSCQGQSIALPRVPRVEEFPPSGAARAGSFGSSKLLSDLLGAEVPVGISYRPQVFDMGPDAARKEIGKLEDQKASAHYSVLVGRKFDCSTKRTSYILRNSWGEAACEARRMMFSHYGSEIPPEVTARRDRKWADENACISGCKRVQRQVDRYMTCLGDCNLSKGPLQNPGPPAPYTCDRGDFVIEEDQLMLVMRNATYLK
jgi:hypothetical protein